MPDRRPRVAALLGSLALVAAIVLLAALPATALAASGREPPIERITIADVPPTVGEDCVDDPDLHPGTGLRECPKGFDLASVLPFVGGGVVVLLALAVGWFLLMRRRASRPFLADDGAGAAAAGGAGSPGATEAASGEWWRCKSCGSTNMVGSARCYNCGSWQR